MKAAIIEDERKLAETLAEGLANEGHEAAVFLDGESFVAETDAGALFDVAILDLGLPGMNGKEVSRRLRAQRVQTPILILTAHDTVPDKVEALDSGADDFLAKPFDFEELMARLRALVRRAGAPRSRLVRVHDVALDLTTRSVTRGEASIDLTPTEFDLLYLLAQNRQRPLSREEISKTLWDARDPSLSNIVDVHISNLRKKLGGYATNYVSTIRGRGYQIA